MSSSSFEFPPQFLGTVLAVWHLFHCGFANSPGGGDPATTPPELEFTPQDLERALMETNPEEQSALLVTIHVTLIKLISRSAQGANTVTWRATMARILSYGGGNRVRNRLRHLQDKYEKLVARTAAQTDAEDADLELGAIFGSIALHPFFSEDVKRQLVEAAKADDVFEEAQSVLAPYGKTSVDSLALLLNEAKLQQRRRAAPMMDIVGDDDDLGGIVTTTTTTTVPSELAKPPRVHNMHKKNQQRYQQAQEKLQQEGEQESFKEMSFEEAEPICQALIQFELTEYSSLPLETKCFILDYLIEYFMDSKHVRDLMETALEEAAQLEGAIAELEHAHQELELASLPRQVAFILNALRERMRIETLRKIYAEDWQAKHDKSSADKKLATAATASNGEEEEEALPTAGRGGRKVKPETYIGKTINRSMFNIVRQAEVVSYDSEMEKFRIEYEDEDEAGFFEYLTVAEVRKPVHAKCTDEQFVNVHVSDHQLKQLTQEQLALVREHFANLGTRKDRQLAIERLNQVVDDDENELCVGATVECGMFGRGFCLSIAADFVHVQFVWGGMGSLQPCCVRLAAEPVHSREAFLQESSEQMEEISLQKRRFERYTQMLRFSPTGKQDNVWVFPKPNTRDEFVLLCPDPNSDERGEIRAFTGLNFPHQFASSPIIPPQEFDLPFWLLPDVLQQKVASGVLSKQEASKPNTLTRLLLGRLESDLEPWLAKPTPSSAQEDIPDSLQASKTRLLDLEANLMQGLAELAILRHFTKPAETSAVTEQQPASKEAAELLQRPADNPPRDRPPFTLKNQGSRFRKAPGFREIISSYPTVEQAWQEKKVELIQSLIWDDVSSAQLIFTSLDAFWQQEVCEKWQKLCEARTSLQSAHAADTKQFSLDPAVAACSDAALVFLLRWLEVRKKWRNRIMQHAVSFSELAGCAVSLERASYELRRAGASAGLARDQVFRKNSRACYFPSLHREYSTPELLHIPSVTPASALPYAAEDDGNEPKILRIRRVDLHRDFYYLALQTNTLVEDEEDEEEEAGEDEQQDAAAAQEEEVLPTLTPRKRPSLAMFSSGSDSDSDSEAVDSNEENDDEEEERRRQAQIEIDQNGRETSVHTRRPWYHYKIKPRLRLSVACIEDGCEKNAVESNMGYCEDHRTVKKRGRPIGSTSVKKKKPLTAKQRQQAAAMQNHDDEEDADFPPSRRPTAAIQATPEIDESGAALSAAAAATENRCYVCLSGGNLVCCDSPGCVKAYHQTCLLAPAPEKTADASPWLCPLHTLPVDSREYKVTKSLTNVLDAIAELDSAHLIVGKGEPRDEADDLISIRRKLVLHHAYATFEEMHQDANRLRKRFLEEAQASGDTALELAVERLWKNFKVRISRAKTALDGGPQSIREPRERTMQSGTKILRSSYANQYQTKVIQYDAASRVFFDGEALDANGFFEQIEQNQPIRPGKVMFNLGYAQELCKSSHWPTTGTRDRLERMGTINKSGKRLKMDDFASVEDFELYADETLMIVRRDAPYLQTEKTWKRAQLESQTQQYVDEFKQASEVYLATVKEFDQWKQEAVNAWFLICKPRDTWSVEQYNYMSVLSQHFAALAQRFKLPSKPSPTLLLEADESPAAPSAEAAGGVARPSPLVVNLVWNQRRLARPSNQRLVGLVNMKRQDRWFDSVKVGDRVFVKLNPKADLFGWPAEVVTAEPTSTGGAGGELMLGIRFEYDVTERRVHEGVRASDYLVRNPMHDQPDTGLREGVQVAVVNGTQVKLAVVKSLALTENKLEVVVPNADGTSAEGVQVNLSQVRSMPWIHAAMEQGRLQQQQLLQQQAATPGVALYNKQRAVKRDTQILVNAHVKRSGIEIAQLPATFPSSAQFDSDTFDIGDYVDVHILQHQTWKLGQVLARVSTNVLQVKTIKDGKVFQVDKRLVRKPQRKQQ